MDDKRISATEQNPKIHIFRTEKQKEKNQRNSNQFIIKRSADR